MDIAPRSDDVVIVLESTCGEVFTFNVVAGGIVLLDESDLYDSQFDKMTVESSFDEFHQVIATVAPNLQGQRNDWGCGYRIRVYPSNDMSARYFNGAQWIPTLIVVSIFVFTSGVFLTYDFIVRRIQAKVLNFAQVSQGIVTSLFPPVVLDRLYGQKSPTTSAYVPLGGNSTQLESRGAQVFFNPKALLKSYLSHPPSVDVSREPEPITDLFTSTTVLFADIAGFTAWSSEREPSQVFVLLETLYRAFDHIADELGVFKVETIGDCYVAVPELPKPRPDHAVVMDFASECLRKMSELTKMLESVLGPGTSDLVFRIGLYRAGYSQCFACRKGSVPALRRHSEHSVKDGEPRQDQQDSRFNRNGQTAHRCGEVRHS